MSLVHNPEGALVVNEHIDIALKKEVVCVSAWAKLRVIAALGRLVRIRTQAATPRAVSCA